MQDLQTPMYAVWNRQAMQDLQNLVFVIWNRGTMLELKTPVYVARRHGETQELQSAEHVFWNRKAAHESHVFSEVHDWMSITRRSDNEPRSGVIKTSGVTWQVILR